MDADTYAARIVENVARRGYLPEERPAWQILARQVEKLVEEFGELVACLECQLHPWMRWYLQRAATQARLDFDDDDGWTNTPPPTSADLARAWSELADMLVVLRVAEYAINQARGTSLSLDEAALTKSAGDVARGVRYGGGHG